MLSTRTILVPALTLAACLAGCSGDVTPAARSTSPRGERAEARPTPEEERVVAPIGVPATATVDPNTQTEEVADPSVPTAEEQSTAPEDVELTRLIREAVVDDASLSMSARNVVIVTRERIVTLRGDVSSDTERQAIERHARAAAGVSRVENRITVSP